MPEIPPDTPPNSNDEDRKSVARALSVISQLAFSTVICVGLGLLIGYGLDRLFNTSPILLILFSFFGSVAGIKTMIDIARKI